MKIEKELKPLKEVLLKLRKDGKILVALLAEHTKLTFNKEQLQFLAQVNRFNIEARYPDYKFRFQKLCSAEFTDEQFSKIKEMYKWLLSQMK